MAGRSVAIARFADHGGIKSIHGTNNEKQFGQRDGSGVFTRAVLTYGGDQNLRYFRQGPHDGLCGFVAAINAVRFLQHAVDRHDDINENDFFNEAVECLARLPGCDLRILKNDPAVGGIDPFQVRDLCVSLVERLALPLTVSPPAVTKMRFATRYRLAYAEGQQFALVAPFRDGSHWVAALSHSDRTYCLVDHGYATITALSKPSAPKLATDAVVELRLV
ncbi:hypothetical protein [uncultured Sphingomonas sp.]|uniref:hypothetical protein n=1 Tax=uncultured Sphingomonas sp. TaxID=158754 RepID=UPI0025DC3F32|nr:hypothetical protein [uncultured Sphingomonas sp.]